MTTTEIEQAIAENPTLNTTELAIKLASSFKSDSYASTIKAINDHKYHKKSKLTDKQRKILKISDAILDIIDHSEDMTRSDLQGVVEALAMQIVNGTEA